MNALDFLLVSLGILLLSGASILGVVAYKMATEERA